MKSVCRACVIEHQITTTVTMIIRIVGDSWVSADNIVCSVAENEAVSKCFPALVKKLKVKSIQQYLLRLHGSGV